MLISTAMYRCPQNTQLLHRSMRAIRQFNQNLAAQPPPAIAQVKIAAIPPFPVIGAVKNDAIKTAK